MNWCETFREQSPAGDGGFLVPEGFTSDLYESIEYGGRVAWRRQKWRRRQEHRWWRVVMWCLRIKHIEPYVMPKWAFYPQALTTP